MPMQQQPSNGTGSRNQTAKPRRKQAVTRQCCRLHGHATTNTPRRRSLHLRSFRLYPVPYRFLSSGFLIPYPY